MYNQGLKSFPTEKLPEEGFDISEAEGQLSGESWFRLPSLFHSMSTLSWMTLLGWMG